jgi:hypothetical protein
MELVTLIKELQNLGALDKEALVIGGFFLFHRVFASIKTGKA